MQPQTRGRARAAPPLSLRASRIVHDTHARVWGLSVSESVTRKEHNDHNYTKTEQDSMHNAALRP